MSDLLNRVGRSAFSYLASGGGEAGGDDFVGSLVEVNMPLVHGPDQLIEKSTF